MTVDALGQAFATYRRTADTRALIALIAANSIPLLGVLFLGWSLWTILVIYWLENGIVGFWNVPRMLLAGGGAGPGIARLGTAGFFVVHYGIFWLVHGVFVFALPLFAAVSQDSDTPFGEILWSSVAVAAIALFLSHGASFAFNYVGRGEYRRTSAAAQMAAPYARVVALHLAILLGAFAIAFIGVPIGALVILVLVKTFFDLSLHLREHRARA